MKMKRTYFPNAKKHPQYTAYMGMFERCYNPKNKSYKNYGARGITVCDRWHDFAKYLEDVGEKPIGMYLDRIDNNGNYEPSNVKWSTSKEQNRNKRNNVYIMLDGVKTLLPEAARILNQEYHRFYERMKYYNFKGDAREYYSK